METKLITGLKQVQGKYDTFFIDLWGVVHNGVHLYSEAINVLENLSKLKKRFVLISNAPRPSKSVEKYLIKLKMDKDFLTNQKAILNKLWKWSVNQTKSHGISLINAFII